MAKNNQKLLFCFLILNVTVVFMIFTGAGEVLWDHSRRVSTQNLLALNATKDSQRLLRGSPKAPSLDPIHPFDQVSKRLGEFDWDPNRIDEFTRKFWETEKTFLEYEFDRKTKENRTILSTSCLHTAAWIVTGLLDLQKRPNFYMGLWKLPKDKDLVVYDNTQKPRSPLAAPVIKSLKSFIDSRPLDEPILLQIDMYQPQDQPSNYYIDHHFAIHVYNGQINLYHSWQDIFTLIDWMKWPGAFKLRYPMPVETFLGHFETFLSYAEEKESRKRLEEIWKIFGITDTFTYGRKEDLDPVVRRLRYPWTVTLITHWPSPQTDSNTVK